MLRSLFLRTVAAAGAGALVPAHAAAQTLTTIRVLGPPNDGMKAVYYGVESGLFKRFGLTVQVSRVNSGAAGTAAVIGGAAEVVFVNIITLVQAHAHDVPLVFLVPGPLTLADNSPTSILVRKDADIHTGADLNGKTVGAPALRDVNAVATLAWIDKNGGDSRTVHVIEIPTSVGEAALVQGRADAVTMNEPAVSQALADGTVRILGKPYSAVANRIMTVGFAAMQPVIDRNLELMSRFARAMHESAAYTNAHLPQTVDLVASYTGERPDIVAKSVRMVDDAYLDAADIQPLIDLTARYDLIDRPFAASEIISPAALRPR